MVPVSAIGVQVDGDDGARVPVIAAWAGMAQQAKNHSGALRQMEMFFMGFLWIGFGCGLTGKRFLWEHPRTLPGGESLKVGRESEGFTGASRRKGPAASGERGDPMST